LLRQPQQHWLLDRSVAVFTLWRFGQPQARVLLVLGVVSFTLNQDEQPPPKNQPWDDVACCN
ncbi:hypothetical protein, partial [Polaromonas sp.]|uniref:hypothetical protein n=1 Tax=Polaromonas sp. TaxID=1869339 RepID=UPI003BB745DE